MIWLVLFILVVIAAALLVSKRPEEFPEAKRRSRALQTLSELYSPADDTCLKRRMVSNGTAAD